MDYAMSNHDTKDFWQGVMIILIGLILLALTFITAPDQVFDDCSGTDVPAHCVE
jgi:hypothetical protein